MKCPYCNAEISDNMKFCENCGSALSVYVEQPEAVPFSDEPQPAEAVQSGQVYGQPYVQQPANQQYSQSYAQQPTDQQYGQPYAQQNTDPYANTQQYGQQSAGQPGYSSYPPGVYTAPASTGAPVSIAPFVLSIIALVTSLLGLFPVSIVLAIIALVMNSGQKKRGELSSKQTPTTIMSVISLVVSALVLVATIVLGGMVMAYLESGDYSVSADKNGSISISTQKSSSAAASASAGATSSGEPSESTAEQGESAGDVVSMMAGTWKLTGLVSDGEVMDADSLEFMQNMGLTVELIMSSDGKAVLTLFGVEMSGIWESPDGITVHLILEGETIDATVSGNVLTMAVDTDALTFTKQ